MAPLFFVFQRFTAIRPVIIVLMPEKTVPIPVVSFFFVVISPPLFIQFCLYLLRSFSFFKKSFPVFVIITLRV